VLDGRPRRNDANGSPVPVAPALDVKLPLNVKVPRAVGLCDPSTWRLLRSMPVLSVLPPET
jgi:hypothetical protein